MRIVSLLPAITEWVFALKAGESLVGCSQACSAPEGVPRVAAPPSGSQPAVLKADVLQALEPDLIIASAHTETTWISASQIESLLESWTGKRPEVLAVSMRTFKQTLDAVLRIARRVNHFQEGMQLIAAGEQRLRMLHARIGLQRRANPETLPSVACLLGLQPLTAAGYWVPDVIDLAGGRPLLRQKKTPPGRVSWQDLRRADPDVIIVAQDESAASLCDSGAIARHEVWNALRAVQEGRVYHAGSSAGLDQPGPRLYDAVEGVARVLYPNRFKASAPLKSGLVKWPEEQA